MQGVPLLTLKVKLLPGAFPPRADRTQGEGANAEDRCWFGHRGEEELRLLGAGFEVQEVNPGWGEDFLTPDDNPVTATGMD